MSKYYDITIALAGVYQASLIVTQLATEGSCDKTDYENAVKTLFVTDPPSTEAVFGTVATLYDGLNKVIAIMSGTTKDNLEVTRYAFSALALSNKLLKNSHALSQIEQRLLHINQYTSQLPENEEQVSYSLAGIYSDVISPLGNKIKVTGHVNILQNLYTQAKIRTSLFTAVRAGILWYQVGGNRWNFFLQRKKIITVAKEMLQTR